MSLRPASELPDVPLSYLYKRCTACEDGCMLWDGQMDSGPKVTFKRKQYKVLHLVWKVAHDRAPAKWQIPQATVCGNERCIAPAHLSLVKRNAHARGKPMPLLQRANIAAAKRASHGKIDLPAAESIRTSDEPLQVLADRHGIAMATVHRIKHNEAWIDYRNPFTQLLGRAP